MTVVDDLMHEHLPLARTIARRFVQRGFRYDDAYSDALVGLWNAIGGYDETKGPWGAYATRRITGEILDGHRRVHGRVGPNHRRHCRPEPLSLDRPLDEDGITLADLIPDQLDGITAWWDRIDAIEQADRDRQQLAEIRRSIRHQSPRDRALINGHIAGRTFADLAAEHGICESRVSQIWRAWQTSLNPAAPRCAMRSRLVA